MDQKCKPKYINIYNIYIIYALDAYLDYNNEVFSCKRRFVFTTYSSTLHPVIIISIISLNMKKVSLPNFKISNDHPQHSSKRQIIVSGLVLLFLITITVLVILYGKGYRLFVQEGEPKLTKTGILNLTSNPTGAEVYVNDHLTTATNGTLNLTPAKYTI